MKCCRFVTFVTLTAFVLAFMAACDTKTPPGEKPNITGVPGGVKWKCEEKGCKTVTEIVGDPKKAPECPVHKKALVKGETVKFVCAKDGCTKTKEADKEDKIPEC